MKKLFPICSAIAMCVCAGICQLRAQKSDDDPSATITFNTGRFITVSSNGRVFELVGLQPNESVDVQVYFSIQKAGRTLRIEALDGGFVSSAGNAVSVAGDGTISFRFQAGFSPGRYQVSVQDGAHEVGLQFWVLDSTNPQNNPRVLTVANPNI